MKHKIQYTKFDFNQPKVLGESDYNTLKALLSKNPKCKFAPKLNLIVAFNYYLYLFGISAIAVLVLILDLAEWLNIIAAIPLFIAFYTFLFSFIPTMVSFLEYLNDKSKYYSKLRKVVINSSDYSEYLRKCRF